MNEHEMNSRPFQSDSWESGESYQRYVGRWSRLVAAEFIGWLAAPQQKNWLDIGCGTGSLSRTILELASPAALKAVDPSQKHISYARTAIQDDRVTFLHGTAEGAQLPDEAFDYIVSGLVLNFVPDPKGSVTVMKRLTHRGGVIGAYVWDYAGKMELMRYFWDAAVSLDKAAVTLDEGNRFSLCSPEALKELFLAADLSNVEVRPIDISTRFENFDDYWAPFLGGQGPAPGYAMSLSEERRKLLRDRIHSVLPVADDGTIRLIARAWAIKGRKI